MSEENPIRGPFASSAFYGEDGTLLFGIVRPGVDGTIWGLYLRKREAADIAVDELNLACMRFARDEIAVLLNRIRAKMERGDDEACEEQRRAAAYEPRHVLGEVEDGAQ